MAIKTFTTGEVLTSSDTNTYLANSGLVFVTSVNVGTGVASFNVPNAFSATYDSYRIVMSNVAASNNTAYMLYRSSASASHYGTFAYNLYTNNTTISFDNMNAQTSAKIGFFSNQTTNNSWDVINPFKTVQTIVSGTFYGAGYGGFHGSEFGLTTSFTDFTIFPSSGTVTGGTVTVYGYRKA